MDLKAYSVIWLSVSDFPSLYPQITSSQKTDNFLFKPEVQERGKISLVHANSQGSITLAGVLKVLQLTFH